MSITFVRDATHRNIKSIPPGMLAALYTTGSADIKATTQDFNNHPNAIRICQDHGSDVTADILDVEDFAATPQDAVNWLPKARHSFMSNARPGQRWPGIYASESRITAVANALVTANLTDVPLWVAHFGVPQSDAIARIVAASGPFPIVGMQFLNEVSTDLSVFSTEWVNRMSGQTEPHGSVKVTTPPPLNVKAGTPAIALGLGPQGELVWVTTTTDGRTWTDPKPLNG